MSVSLSTAISALDASKSLLPFFVKDSFNITGRTIMANNESGKHEAREKFIEEAGTSLFWIGGIPTVRAVANKVAKGKIDTDIHFKRINSNGPQGYFAKNLEGVELGGEKLGQIKSKLSGANLGKYKNYHVGVSAAAVLINLVMLTVALPKFNQLLSKKIISKEINEKNKNSEIKPTDDVSFKSNDKVTFSKFLTKTQSPSKSNSPSFGSGLFDVKNLLNFTKIAETSQLNPTASMLLLDYGISGSRVTFVPRDNNERVEYAVKEGGIILFFYYAADWIKKGFTTIANKMFNTPIDLDYKVINDKAFLKGLKDSSNKDELLNFAGDKADELKVIKFIDKELAKAPKTAKKESVFENFTLQMAQKNGLIDVEYDSALGKWIRHSKKYIETDKLVTLNNNLKNFYEKALNKNGANIENIISKTKAIKAFSVLGNIAICCVSLSFLLPKLQYIIREHRTKTTQAPGIKVYQEMAEKKMI